MLVRMKAFDDARVRNDKRQKADRAMITTSISAGSFWDGIADAPDQLRNESRQGLQVSLNSRAKHLDMKIDDLAA